MTIFNKTSYTKLDSNHAGGNYANVLIGTGQEYITDWKISADIKNPLVTQYSPPPAEGLQYEVDRQAQLRNYAQNIDYYKLRLYVRKDGIVFPRKIVPIYKYFPDHQLDLFPLLWSSSQGVLGDGDELLLQFEGSLLPTSNDSIISVVNYFTLNTATAVSWFTLELPANIEVSQQLPDNCYEINLKQINSPQSKLYYSFTSDTVSTPGGRDEINPEFEKTETIVGQNRTLFLFCEEATNVLVKALSI